MSIEVAHLLKSYGEQKVVNDISFRVNKGEIVGFLGPNGAGKSTTLKIITGYLAADSGKARVCELDVEEDPIAVKKHIGYLPESNPLYYDMYVREYLGFVAGVHGISGKKKRMEEVIDLLGLGTESRKKIGQLSKGYKQRTGLAASLIHDPDVLILDEPTTGLDPNQIIEIREVIRQLGLSKTILFSSHILQEVEAICDRVLIIDRGRLVADDRLENLQKNASGSLIIRVGFREVLEPAWLERLPAVRSVNKTDSHSWELQTTNEEEARKQILELALQQNLNIVSLQSGEQSLEEIFRNLTRAKQS